MSFYGNSYYFSANSYASIILKNLGLENYTFTFPSGFQQVEKGKSVNLESTTTNSGVSIASGNHWIQIGSSDKVVNEETGAKASEICLMHSAPVYQADSSIVCPIEKASLTTDEKAILDSNPNIPTIGFNEYFSIPVVRYDDAGHIVFDPEHPEVTYLKMPQTPSVSLQQQIDDLSNLINTYKDKVEEFDGRIKDCETGVAKIDGIQSNISDLQTVTTGSGGLQEQINTLGTDHQTDYDVLSTAISALKSQHPELSLK